ncbi:hypothetical protein QBC35DRAFT_500424 [Podospora australis]|uniref:Uncharacterized protein n=1 Tax=Podospora australis TaxID=1536484 RepID=A0AAN6WUZ4_9PEZI|nr:hypothetical protein QBC35DRAFT_500424 [Podospora australis]
MRAFFPAVLFAVLSAATELPQVDLKGEIKYHVANGNPVKPQPWSPDQPCPTEISANIPYGNRGARFLRIEAVHAAMLLCPGVKTLKIHGDDFSGCEPTSLRLTLPFKPNGGERYPSAPEVLTLDGYASDGGDFKDGEPFLPVKHKPPAWYAGWNEQRVLAFSQNDSEVVKMGTAESEQTPLSGSSAPPKQKSNWELWIDAMDFSRIHTLTFQTTGTSSPYALTDEVASLLPSKLSSLKRLNLQDAVGSKFISSLPPNSLQHLGWRNAWGPSKDKYCGSWIPECLQFPRHDGEASPLGLVLEHTGASLTSLYFHVDDGPDTLPPVLYLDEIQQLVRLAPKLESLALDLRRKDGDWPWDELTVLAENLPHLVNLTIHFDLGSPEAYEWKQLPYHEMREKEVNESWLAEPTLTNITAEEVARFVWTHNAGSKLERLNLRAGDWAPWYPKGMIGPGWPSEHSVFADCSLMPQNNGTSLDETESSSIIRVQCVAGEKFGYRDGWNAHLVRAKNPETYLDYF